MKDIDNYVEEKIDDLKEDMKVKDFCDEELDNMKDRLSEMEDMIKDVDKQMKNFDMDTNNQNKGE